MALRLKPKPGVASAAHMNQRSTAAAFVWSFAERIGTQLLRSIFAIILARLLLPKDFGLVAILAVFVGVAEVIITSGFGTVLIREPRLTHSDECSIFYFNVLVGATLTAILFCASPYVAEFYRSPQLTAIGRITSFNLLITSTCVVQWALLNRRLDFLAQFKVSIISVASSGILAVVMAARGFGVWSIVVQQLCSNTLNALILWRMAKWYPSERFSFRSLQKMFGFSSSFIAINLLDVIAGNISFAIIGKLFTATEAGLYSRAKQIEELPVLTTYATASRPSLSLFARSQDDDAILAQRFRSVLAHLALINFPVVTGIAVVAKPLVTTLLTAKWGSCVPYLRLLCGVGMFFPLQRINLSLIIAKGQSALFVRLELFRTIVAVAFISATGFFGVETMIVGQVIAMAITWYMNSMWIGRTLDYPFRKQLRDVSPYALGSCIMSVAMISLARLDFATQIGLLCAQVALGACIYVTFCWAFNLSAFEKVKKAAVAEILR